MFSEHHQVAGLEGRKDSRRQDGLNKRKELATRSAGKWMEERKEDDSTLT